MGDFGILDYLRWAENSVSQIQSAIETSSPYHQYDQPKLQEQDDKIDFV